MNWLYIEAALIFHYFMVLDMYNFLSFLDKRHSATTNTRCLLLQSSDSVITSLDLPSSFVFCCTPTLNPPVFHPCTARPP